MEEKPREAIGRIWFLMATLDDTMKEKMLVQWEKVISEMNKELDARKWQYFVQGEKAYNDIYAKRAVQLLSRLYSIIYENYSMKDLIGLDKS